ncbi:MULTISPECIES: hypothetical protein [unclassified Proteiniphilum]|jgi:hypothetical protein|uniref:hypothetical protein n=1 Tax=unclassified Proteiniphilum TaxID=2622718 RepID=UPI00257C0A4C|nr:MULTISPECIES: hypothetical protein [unclassified Proteiniphilum]
MKTIRIITIIIFSIFIVSCDRSGIFEEFQKATPWEFHVQVFNDDNMTQTVADAVVNIYKTKEDRDGNTNIFLTRNTGENGEAVFSLKDFEPGLDVQKSKGIYYVRVEKNGIVKNDITRYLLMNDGHTYHKIVLK